jgi:diguanylate cyclase (GGDEF)-like protein
MSETRQPERAARILVIDDDPETGELIRSWFKQPDYEILLAGGGRAGLESAAAEIPDLVLLDLRMPDVDGITVARRLKQDNATHNIPIVLLSACRDQGTKSEAFSVGADDYVTKPFEFEDLDARIRSMLRRRELVVTLQSKIMDLTSTNEELERLLVVDEKTGLYNFREFQRRLKEEWERAQRYQTSLSLVMLDLDHFKQLNDTLGHPAGDRALQEFATLVAGGARAIDIAVRYGGEEFAVILPHTDGSMAVRVAERIRNAVKEFVFLEDESPSRITVSAGVATYPSSRGVDSVDALVRAADFALYEAKNRGRDCVVQDDGRLAAKRDNPSPRPSPTSKTRNPDPTRTLPRT